VISGSRRRSRFVFAQSDIPLVPSPADANDSAALSLSLAIRRERYSEVGMTTNSNVALTYKPIPSIKIQGSWGTSFRAPTLLQQFNTQQAVLEFVPDSTQASGQSIALLRFGGNALLRPETSTDTALDVTLTPEAVPGALLQVGYFGIFYRQRIEYPTLNTGDPLADPNALPFVTHSPGSVTPILQQSQIIDLTGGQYATQGVAEVIDDRDRNFGRQRASGVDLLLKYGRDTPLGTWDTSLNTAYLDLRQQIVNETAMTPLSGTVFYPPVWRGRFGVNWSYGRYLGSVFVNYTGRSRTVSSPEQQLAGQPIASWTTLDGQLGMTWDHWGKTTLLLSAQNMLDRHPPLYNARQPGAPSVNYDSTNTSPVGSFVTLQLTQQW
jgi:iron complex outermembrane recepter protein